MTAVGIATRSIKGSVILFGGNLVYTIASAVSIILIARLLGPAQYGLYALALVIPSLFLNLIDFGVNTAVIRYSAYYNSLGKPEEARHFTINAIRFLWMMGSIFTVLNFVLAPTLSTVLLHRPGLTPYVQLMSLAIIGSTILTSVMNSSMGWNWMSLSSFSQVLQSTFKLTLSPVLIVLGLGVFGALVGHLASFVAAGVLGTIILYLAKLRGRPSPPTSSGVTTAGVASASFVSDVRQMLRFGLAPYTGALVLVLANYYLTILLAELANNSTFGYYQAAVNFITPITLVSSALVYALLPAFASIDGIGGNVQSAFRHAYKFVAFVLTPVIFFLISASGLLIGIFYGHSFLGSVRYLQLLALAYLPIAFGYTVHPAFFNGFGKTKLTLFMNLSSAATLASCAPLFSIVLDLGIDGLIVAIFLSFFVAWAIGTFLASRYMGATLDLKANGAIMLASLLSYAGTLLVPQVGFSSVVTLVLYLFVFFAIYLTLAPLSRAVTILDIDTLELTARDLRFIGRLIFPILRYERLIVLSTSRGRRRDVA